MEKEYNQLRKKYKLPRWKELDKGFQISTIESKKFLLKEIAKKINEKIEFFSSLLEEIFNPETKLSSLHESNTFNDEEKKEVLKIYRKLYFYYRKNSYLEISYDEKETAEYIKEFFDAWQTIKPELKKIITKIKDSWNSDKKTNLELSYFG
ncbi:MAG: hypothetical protein ISS25_00435 [Nanoarchaeota archaeon]|nr:hypothetical protein [DPANN group archaeon]MBL7116284.1 hypothetical protein [Nanoarchaeota archaeon]